METFPATWLAASEPVVVQIGFIESVFGIGAVLIGLGVAWGALHTKVQRIDKDVDELKTETKALSRGVAAIKTILQRDYQQDYAVVNSPRQLTEKGKRVLEKSGIKMIIDDHKDVLTEIVEDMKPQNAYDAEAYVLETVAHFIGSNDGILNEIKDKTFALGEPLDIVYFVGGIYLRDYALPKLGFRLDDVDTHAK